VFLVHGSCFERDISYIVFEVGNDSRDIKGGLVVISGVLANSVSMANAGVVQIDTISIFVCSMVLVSMVQSA